jgi:excinuclease UvrABC helicase subunit UvrB
MEQDSFISPHAAIICGKTNSGKTYQMLNMIAAYNLKEVIIAFFQIIRSNHVQHLICFSAVCFTANNSCVW